MLGHRPKPSDHRMICDFIEMAFASQWRRPRRVLCARMEDSMTKRASRGLRAIAGKPRHGASTWIAWLGALILASALLAGMAVLPLTGSIGDATSAPAPEDRAGAEPSGAAH
ncbi:hypothetical protein A7982_12259 [Minicystis rosea]|nr:hypothetical protein A7982_12259 [Minicystis rosea]